LSSDPSILIGLAAASFAGLGVIVWLYSRRMTPEERERQRRLAVNRHVRTYEGMITEADRETIHYKYEVCGVEYYTAQDVRPLQNLLPEQPERLIGRVGVKFDPANPANSIILCEEWSGLPKVPEAIKENTVHGD
jgi:hypothetical protein